MVLKASWVDQQKNDAPILIWQNYQFNIICLMMWLPSLFSYSPSSLSTLQLENCTLPPSSHRASLPSTIILENVGRPILFNLLHYLIKSVSFSIFVSQWPFAVLPWWFKSKFPCPKRAPTISKFRFLLLVWEFEKINTQIERST